MILIPTLRPLLMHTQTQVLSQITIPKKYINVPQNHRTQQTSKQTNKHQPKSRTRKKTKKHQGEPDEKGIRPKLSIKTECKERKDHLANNPLVFQRQ